MLGAGFRRHWIAGESTLVSRRVLDKLVFDGPPSLGNSLPLLEMLQRSFPSRSLFSIDDIFRPVAALHFPATQSPSAAAPLGGTASQFSQRPSTSSRFPKRRRIMASNAATPHVERDEGEADDPAGDAARPTTAPIGAAATNAPVEPPAAGGLAGGGSLLNSIKELKAQQNALRDQCKQVAKELKKTPSKNILKRTTRQLIDGNLLQVMQMRSETQATAPAPGRSETASTRSPARLSAGSSAAPGF